MYCPFWGVNLECSLLLLLINVSIISLLQFSMFPNVKPKLVNCHSEASVNKEQDDLDEDDKAAKVSNICMKVLHSGVRQAILNRFSNVDIVGLTPKTFTNGTNYSKGMILSLGAISGLLDFSRLVVLQPEI